MSYQQSYRSVSHPVKSTYHHPSPHSSIHRKPTNSNASLRSISPMPSTSVHAQTTTINHLHSPTPSTPLNSFPPQAPVTPSITPPVSEPPLQPSYATPTSTTSAGLPTPLSSTSTTDSTSLKPLTTKEIDDALQTCLRIQNEAVNEHGKRPFAALMLAPDNVTILASHNSISHYQHAESELARLAATQYSAKYLERCTLVSTWEPCAMCAGTIYWTGIGRLLYAASESKLKELTGANNTENMTMSMSCRTVFSAGQRKVEVIGPMPSWEQRIVDEAGKWWREHQQGALEKTVTPSIKDSGSIHSKRTSVTIYNPEDSYLGSIGEDGEYQADLKIDWMP
ncbi:hypothetical protein H2198_010719 [Neophaeococcomyces mojaviensis]|uniref:Uncharacterized protein n=1 Tax=Neophaeococcomyces mojaviensis TaxID=3383035 RepID=A0ACC2ZQW6_9EURO|nr:hypothetical protein H2198_010719 [Knufia sp. JES_112]